MKLRQMNEQEARQVRDAFLQENVDSINAVRWSAMTPTQQAAWTQYRQDLLNIPQSTGFPEDIEWPTQPE